MKPSNSQNATYFLGKSKIQRFPEISEASEKVHIFLDVSRDDEHVIDLTP